MVLRRLLKKKKLVVVAMYRVYAVTGPYGKKYHVLSRPVMNWYGMYETVQEAYLVAKKLNRGLFPRLDQFIES